MVEWLQGSTRDPMTLLGTVAAGLFIAFTLAVWGFMIVAGIREAKGGIDEAIGRASRQPAPLRFFFTRAFTGLLEMLLVLSVALFALAFPLSTWFAFESLGDARLSWPGLLTLGFAGLTIYAWVQTHTPGKSITAWTTPAGWANRLLWLLVLWLMGLTSHLASELEWPYPDSVYCQEARRRAQALEFGYEWLKREPRFQRSLDQALDELETHC